MGTPGASAFGGAGVNKRVRMKENNVLCGTGSVIRFDVTKDAWLSHGAGRRGLSERKEPFLFVKEDGSDEGGYNSKRR